MSPPTPPATKPPFLERSALDRPELRAWALYDWANSAMVTVIITAVYPVYFSTVLCAEPGLVERIGAPAVSSLATGRHAWITAASMLCAAFLAPLLGALADVRGARLRYLAVALGFGLAAVVGLAFLGPGDWRLALLFFGAANVAATLSFVFYDALMPVVAKPEEYDRISTSAYALGYLGGGLVLALNLAWIAKPQWFGLPAEGTLPVRLAFVSVAVWWLVFSLPLLRRVREPAPLLAAGERARGSWRASCARLFETLAELRAHKQAFLFMLAFFAYNDGIGTIIRMSVAYATELELDSNAVIFAILLVQFVGIPCAFAFGAVAERTGAKAAIFFAIGVYVVICVLAHRMDSAAEFYAMAFLVGVVQGGAQALSRSLFARMVPRHKAGEFFGLFAVLEKFAGILGPLAFAFVHARTGHSRDAILVLIAFFVVGAALLARVDVAAGEREARASEESAARAAAERLSLRAQ